jgi:hypothetical protein
MSCYQSYKQKHILKVANYLLKQNCCNEYSCSQLIDDLQDTQFKCNDAFKNAGRNNSDLDEKGNIEGTICSDLRDKKNQLLDRFNGEKLGGKRTRRQNKKHSKRNSKIKNKTTRARRYKKKT